TVALLFFFNDTATTEIYTLSLHDALPISSKYRVIRVRASSLCSTDNAARRRSEEHTSELQSHVNLVCRLLLEKKNIHAFLKHGSHAHDYISIFLLSGCLC